MKNTNNMFRAVLDGGDLVVNAITSLLVQELVATEKLERQDVVDLSQKIAVLVRSKNEDLIDHLQKL